MPSDLPERCCGRCREFKDGTCVWNVAVPVPFYMRLNMDLHKWSELKEASGTACPAFSAKEGSDTK